MTTAFTPILNGTAPCHRVLEDADHLAFLEPCPLSTGHVVVVPKKEIDHFFDLEENELAAFMRFAKKVARGLKRAVACEKIAVIVYGLKVRHAHMHLIPVVGVPGELDLGSAKRADEADLETIADQIREQLA
jgi:histidine triad (HIT) family protein